MPKNEQQKQESNKNYGPIGKPDPEPDQALILFGGTMKMLPAELESMGLAGKVQAREIPGVPPNWKPVTQADFLLGRCVDKRTKVFDPGTPKERSRDVLVFDTAIPGGFRSVWLGADLRLKMNDPVGKVYSIYYDGETDLDGKLKLNPMKSYRVYEILPAEGLLPEGVETRNSG